MPIHANSASAYHSLDLNERCRDVLRVFVDSSVPLTDREVLARLGQTDPNYCRPRITDMVTGSPAWLEECGDTVDKESRKTVRLCRPTAHALRLLAPSSADSAALASRMHDRKTLALYIASQGARGATKSELARQFCTITPANLPNRLGELRAFDIITDQGGEIRGCEVAWLITSHGVTKLELPAETWFAGQVAQVGR